MKKKLVVLQEGNKDCGVCCLLSIIRYYNGNISLNKLMEMTKTTKNGTTFYNLSEAASKIGMASKAYYVDDFNNINVYSCPFISQVIRNGYTHFVVVYKISKDKLLIMDPALGSLYMSREKFLNIWTSYIMMFEKVKILPNYKDEKYINKLLYGLILNNKKIIVNCLLLTLMFCFLTIGYSVYLKVMIDKVLNQDKYLLIVISLIFFIVILFRSLTNLFRNQMLSYFNMKVDISLFLNSFKRILLLPYNYYKNKTTGEIISRVNDLSYIKQIISQLLTTVFLDIVLLLFSLVCLYFINSKMFVISFFIAILYVIIIFIYPRFIKTKIYESQAEVAKVNSYLVESISGLETIKGLRCEKMVNDRLESYYTKAQATIFDYNIISNGVLFLKDLIFYVGILLINYVGCVDIMNGNFTVGSLLTFNTILGYFLNPLQNFIDLADDYVYVRGVFKRANGLYEVKLDDLESKNGLRVEGDISFNNLDFSFNGKDQILKSIKIEFKAKEKILLLGNSGSGKSTLLKILYKYYDVSRGMVLVNGIDINDFSISDIRDDIIYVSQNETLYTGSIKDNILLNRDIDYKDFLDMCCYLEVDNIIKDNLLGYDFLLEENGANISGGERQRIILARALFKKGNIILIDEGLSQMDIDLERRVLKRIFSIFKDKMIIVVSHRFNNMDLYDKVFKLKDGMVDDCLTRG
ncbi:MAG: peptidase domain-containing ABC transporter [Bacilli bacterium]